MGLIFAEFATSLKSPKIDKAKNKRFYTSSFRVHELAKIGLSENLTHLALPLIHLQIKSPLTINGAVVHVKDTQALRMAI